ncbi:MAG TPA: GAF domain-containing sensor histidine kinase [Gemmatimonadaceae bacterium]|nr:GAF domain-containing sensor histidine kinase [Gemmatimonadaceae bacterium]
MRDALPTTEALQLQPSPELTSATADRPAKPTADASAEVARLREELDRVRTRATKLLGLNTALSEARSVDDVTRVVLSKGLAVVEAARGILISLKDDKVTILGSSGFSPALIEYLDTITLDTDVPIVDAMRKGEMVSLESGAEFEARYGGTYAGFSEIADMQTYLAMPLVHTGETIGAITLHFKEAGAVGASDRMFTSLLAQVTATALARARSYDAEQEKRKTAELVAQAREEVLGVVAHDLRNPLSLIVTTTELLEENLEPERRQQILEIAKRAGRQMNRLIGDLLDTVHMESGKLSLDVEDLSVGVVLRQADETFQPRAERRQILLTVILPDDEVFVRADPLRVQQVLGNLIGNALKFTPDDGYVTVRAVPGENEVTFYVTDSGPGIPAEQVPHLFEQFWQARNDKRGVGLGLTIARGIVDAHGGRIWCESTVGSGSTFAFTLPRVKPSTAD